MLVVSLSAYAKRAWFSENKLAVFAFESPTLKQEQHLFVPKHAVADYPYLPIVNGFCNSLAFPAKKDVLWASHMQADALA